MKQELLNKSMKIISDLIENHDSMRDFSRVIREDASDVLRWKHGKCFVKSRAVISICRLFDYVKPNDLNPIFPEDLEFIFKKGKK